MADIEKKVVTLKEGVAAIRDWANKKFSFVGHKHTKADITDFPDSMKNPTSLKISVNGVEQASYDGSTAKSVDITKSSLGLSNINNTPDSEKTVKEAGKVSNSFTVNVKNGTATTATVYDGSAAKTVDITKDAIGLGSVDNTADSAKNVNTAKTLATARSISITGGASADAVAFDGSKNIALNVKSIDGTKIIGTIPLASIPAGAQERLVTVENKAARLKLTTASVQNGDTVQESDTGLMYRVVDETKLSSDAGYKEYTAGTASRVPWSGVQNPPATYAPSAHTHKKSEITDFPASLKNPNSLKVQLNGGTTEGTNQFTYDGSAAKSLNINASNVGALPTSTKYAGSDSVGGKANSAKTADNASLLKPNNDKTTYGASTWRGTIKEGKVVWGESFKDPDINGGKDTGDMTFWLANSGESAATLNMSIDGNFYASGSNKVLHAGNYNNYAPTKTGGGASGTWPISVSGNAATATKASSVDWANTGHPATFPPSSHNHDDRYFTETEINSFVYKDNRNDGVGATTDWNSLYNAGSYKVQMASWGAAATYHAPNNLKTDLYSFGILMVFKSSNGDSEHRVCQLYMPHNTGSNTWCYRWHNGSDWTSGWSAWQWLSTDNNSTYSTLKNPYALTISLNGASQGGYDGSAAKSINISPASIGAAASGHNHDSTYLKLSGGTMGSAAYISWPDSGNWSKSPSNSGVTFPVDRGGFSWSGQSDGIKLYAEETASDNLELVLKFTDDNSNGLSIRNAAGAQTGRIDANGIFTGTFNGKATSSGTATNLNGGTIKIGKAGDSWISGMTQANAPIQWTATGVRDGSRYDPIMWGKDTGGNVWNFGWGADGNVGLYGYKNGKTANGYDGRLVFDPSSGTTYGSFSGTYNGYTLDLNTNNTSDTWVPVLANNKLQHRVIPANAKFTDTNTWRGITDSYSGTDAATSLSQKGANSLYNALLNGYANSAGSATTATKVTSRGVHAETASGTTANSPTTGMADTGAGMYMTQGYNSTGTPTSYGNVINLVGSGTGQIFAEWSGSDSTTGHVYYRSHRDTSTGGWGPWKKFAFTDEIAGSSQTKITLKAASWTGTAAPYTYEIDSKYANKSVIVSFDGDSGTVDQLSWLLGANVQGGTSAKLHAFGRKPTVDIPVILNVIG